MSDKYKGVIGSADAMDASNPLFVGAYCKAANALLQAVVEFELATGRIVDSITLTNIDVTTFGDKVPQTIRTTSLHFLPKPGEVAW